MATRVPELKLLQIWARANVLLRQTQQEKMHVNYHRWDGPIQNKPPTPSVREKNGSESLEVEVQIYNVIAV